jgi:hypothetical protein
MPVSYALRDKSVSLHDTIEPQSLEIVQRMLNAGEVIHIGLGNIDLQILSSLNLANVRSINISEVPCYDLGFLASVNRLESLRFSYGAKLKIGKNIRLDTIPSSNSLTALTLVGVKGLKNLPQFPNLEFLHLDGINENLGFLKCYPALKDMVISGYSIEGFNEILHCKNLVRLRMIQDHKVDFSSIVADHAVNSSLKILEISHCRDLINFDFLKQFPAVKYMDITSCRNISSFEGIEDCKHLEVINVSQCRVKDKDLRYLLHINNVLLGMAYGKEEIANFANEFKGKVYSIYTAEKGYLNYSDFYTKYYGGKIEDIPGL